MIDGLLDGIIVLEKRLQAEVVAERARAEEWQARELAALQGHCREFKLGEEARCRETLAEQEALLTAEGKTIEIASAHWCRRLSEVNDQILRDVLKRHLAAILPGGDYDHPYGQS